MFSARLSASSRFFSSECLGMAKTYSERDTSISPATLDDDCLLAIGKIIRALAEIDDLITFYFMRLTGMSETQTLVTLGQLNIGAKIAKCETLARLAGEKAHKAHTASFTPSFRDLLYCRNVVAHGALLGMTQDDEYAFLALTEDPQKCREGLSFGVASYTKKTLLGWASLAPKAVSVLEHNLQLQPLRKKRLQQNCLLAHPKTRKKQNAKPKDSAPPQSSRA